MQELIKREKEKEETKVQSNIWFESFDPNARKTSEK